MHVPQVSSVDGLRLRPCGYSLGGVSSCPPAHPQQSTCPTARCAVLRLPAQSELMSVSLPAARKTPEEGPGAEGRQVWGTRGAAPRAEPPSTALARKIIALITQTWEQLQECIVLGMYVPTSRGLEIFSSQ